MSGPNGFDEDGPPNDKALIDCVNRVLRCMGVQKASDFSKHARSCTHEDCLAKRPKGGEESNDKVVVNGELTPPPSSRPSFEHLCPPRLRPLLPPVNFGAVVPSKVYRSSFPQVENIAFLKSLKLKTILTLVEAEYPADLTEFVEESGIRHVRILVPANKGAIQVADRVIDDALGVVLDKSNHPLLIHCNKGKHRTGCLVACLRKTLGEPLPAVVEEYHTYAAHKARLYDEVFLELFDARGSARTARAFGWRTDGAGVGGAALPAPRAGLALDEVVDAGGWGAQVAWRVRS